MEPQPKSASNQSLEREVPVRRSGTQSQAAFVAFGLLLGLAVGAAVAVGAQTTDAVKPTDYQTGSSCDARATKHLLAAVDPNQREWQEWNLNAAEAYRELVALGFREC